MDREINVDLCMLILFDPSKDVLTGIQNVSDALQVVSTALFCRWKVVLAFWFRNEQQLLINGCNEKARSTLSIMVKPLRMPITVPYAREQGTVSIVSIVQSLFDGTFEAGLTKTVSNNLVGHTHFTIATRSRARVVAFGHGGPFSVFSRHHVSAVALRFTI